MRPVGFYSGDEPRIGTMLHVMCKSLFTELALILAYKETIKCLYNQLHPEMCLKTMPLA